MKKAIAILLAVCFVLSLTAAAASASPKHRGTSFQVTNVYEQQAKSTNFQANFLENNVVNIGGSKARAGIGIAAAGTTVIVSEQSNKYDNDVNQLMLFT